MSSLSWIDADELSDRLRGLDGPRPSAGPTEAEAADTVRPRAPLPTPSPASELGSTLPPRGAPPRVPAARAPSTRGSQARAAAWSAREAPQTALPPEDPAPAPSRSPSERPAPALPPEDPASAPSRPPSERPAPALPPEDPAPAPNRSPSASESPTTPPAREAHGRPVVGGDAAAAAAAPLQPRTGVSILPPGTQPGLHDQEASASALAVEVAPPVYPPELGLDARLERFRAWMRACGLDHFFVADAEGLPLLLQGSRESEAVRAIAFERALRPLRGLLGGASPGALGLQLEDGRGVQTVWVQTPEGRVAVGMSSAQPVSWALCAAVQAAMFGVFAREDDHA